MGGDHAARVEVTVNDETTATSMQRERAHNALSAWKPLASTIGGSGAGLASGLGIAGASPEQMAYAGMAWSILAVAGVVGWVANVIVTRRYVHIDELLDERDRRRQAEKLAEKYLNKWIDAETRQAVAVRLVQEKAIDASSVQRLE